MTSPLEPRVVFGTTSGSQVAKPSRVALILLTKSPLSQCAHNTIIISHTAYFTVSGLHKAQWHKLIAHSHAHICDSNTSRNIISDSYDSQEWQWLLSLFMIPRVVYAVFAIPPVAQAMLAVIGMVHILLTTWCARVLCDIKYIYIYIF